jgi:hypothetical protein
LWTLNLLQNWTEVTKEQIIQEMDRALDAIPGIDPSFPADS